MNLELLKKYECVVFDLDGTLVNSMPLHIRAWQKTMKRYDIVLDEEWLYMHGGVPSSTIAKYVISQYNLENITPKELADIKAKHYLETISTVEIYPKMLEVLDYLKSNHIPMAIGTGTLKYNATYIVGNTALSKYIDVVVTAEDVIHHKPDPETFLVACSKLGKDPTKSAVFEDTPLGIEAAQKGGFTAILVEDGIPFIK